MFKINNCTSDKPKKNKIYICILVFVVVLFLSHISANASTLADKLGDPTEYISDNGYDINDYPYYFIVQMANGDYQYVFSNVPFNYKEVEKDKDYSGVIQISDMSKWHWVSCIYSNGTFNTFKQRRDGRWNVVNYSYMCYSNQNIRYTNNPERVFFYANPSTKTDYPIIGGNISTQTIVNLMSKEILTILPFLAVLVVSFLALRKGLAIIFRHLRQG